jgi:hypothetical protein
VIGDVMSAARAEKWGSVVDAGLAALEITVKSIELAPSAGPRTAET